MRAARRFPISYDYFKALVALVLLLLIIWSWPKSSTAPTADVQVDPSGAVTFSGSAAAGSQVKLEVTAENGVKKRIEVNADSFGNWLASAKFTPGKYSLVAASGLSRSQALEFEVPKPAAYQSIIFNALPQDAAPPLKLSGKAQPGEELIVVVDGEEKARVRAAADGSWSYDYSGPVGGHVIQLAYAAAPDVTSEPLTLEVAGAGRPAPRLAKIEKRGAEVTFSGQAAPGSVVYVWLDGGLLGEADADSSGGWFFKTTVAAGDHEVMISSDEAGEVSSAPGSFSVAAAAESAPVTRQTKSEPNSGQPYVVKEGDWLTKLARDYLGSESRFAEIRDATNAKAASDPSFATIEDDNLIYPGEKIWLPAR